MLLFLYTKLVSLVVFLEAGIVCESLIEVPFYGIVKSLKCVTFAPAKHNVKNSVPRTVR